MLGNFLSMLRKRRRVDDADDQDGLSGNSSSSSFWDTYFSGSGTRASQNPLERSNYNLTPASDLVEALQCDNNQLDRFVTVLDQLDARVEKFRKDALGLQEKRDFLLMSVDLIKSHDLLQNMLDSDREEIICYIHRVNSRLSTVELNVRTVRDSSQEDSLSQINALIDMMITMGDPVMSRQRCQQYLNSCSSGMHFSFADEPSGVSADTDVGPVDKQFENALLGCTLDDQKNIKRRLQALMNYLNKQTIRHHAC